VKVAILLLAAGRGTRLGGPVPKAFLDLDGAPLLVHSARRLSACTEPSATDWHLVVHPDDVPTHLEQCLPALHAACRGARAFAVTAGGASRQGSVRNGLAACSPDVDLVLVHDAARALLPVAATRACVEAAARHGAALLAVPTADTIKRVHEGRVTTTVDRRELWAAQTPQVIRRSLLAEALQHALATGFEGTDDVSLVEHLGAPVAVVAGTTTNLKITRPDDLRLASALLAANLA
jgi:2-C-methyl-D-erythritol 4-phosphate cytidylyltransferase